MKNIYVIAKFKLHSLDLKDEWKKLSDIIGADMKENAKGLIFRDSTVDQEGNVQCILKWESLEAQQAFQKIMEERFKNEPEMVESFAKVADMSTMSKEISGVI